MGKSTPSPPNPYTTATAQTQSNVQTAETQAKLNNTDQYTPLGSSVYTQNPNGSYNDTVSLSAPEQAILNQSQANQSQYGKIAGNQLSQVSSALSSPLSYAGMPAMGASSISTGAPTSGYSSGGPIQMSVANPSQFGAEGQQAQNAVLGRLQPFMQQNTNSLQAQLANQGLTPGTQAYNQAMLQNSQSNNDLALGAVQTGDNEMQQLYGDALSSGQFTNQAQAQQNSQNAAAASFYNQAQMQNLGQQQIAGNYADQQRQQAINQALTLRQEPLNETAALMNGSQVSNPTFQNTAQTGVSPTNISQLIEQNYAQQSQNASAQNAGITGLGSTALLAALMYA